MAQQLAESAAAAVGANLARVQARIADAAVRAGRAPASVCLVGVSKTFPAESVLSAARAGLQDIGENRVQEAIPKAAAVALAGASPRWHLIGHLQTNKVKAALALFAEIESVDSLHLAESLSRHAVTPIEVLLEVNVAGESSKTGFSPAEILTLAGRIADLPGLDVRGLMTVAPLADDPEDVRPVFRQLRELGQAVGLPELSMGMSGDYEVAISEGATIVRIGRAIFGARE
jgi:pyridoxal phosphate enzyme (YggS family)